jgi:hypothetical protein
MPASWSRIAKNELKEQIRLGYRLSLNGKPEGFINGLMIADMSNTWRKAGINCKGLNYFTLGELRDGLSTRFIPDHDFYQAWLGGYLIDCDTQTGLLRIMLRYLKPTKKNGSGIMVTKIQRWTFINPSFWALSA